MPPLAQAVGTGRENTTEAETPVIGGDQCRLLSDGHWQPEGAHQGGLAFIQEPQLNSGFLLHGSPQSQLPCHLGGSEGHFVSKQAKP